MISVSQEQLSQVKYLIEQSAQGNHVLFDQSLVREVFLSSTQPMSEMEAKEVEAHIEKILTLQNIEKQRAYLRSLPSITLSRVVKTYFNIVENSLYEQAPLRH